ncbi:MAG: IS1595 family transposase [Armatimonadetes bacterium]|nr:IS1595 family transposase [Armatimonadota bacterium]MDE2205729.1 IS1595 family transposase [Armatimonadota bacterium]
MSKTPVTLTEAVEYLRGPEDWLEYVVSRRGPKGVVCPMCASTAVTYLPGVNCSDCSKRHGKRQLTAKSGSILEDSPPSLDKRVIAVWLIVHAMNGISTYGIHRALGVTQDTGWFMLHRIRLAVQNGSLEKLGDWAEADETYTGSKARNMHKQVRDAKITGTGGKGKAAAFGMLERNREGKRRHVCRRTKKNLRAVTKNNPIPGRGFFTNALKSYDGLGETHRHRIIDHAVSYVDGSVHTNGMKNVWSLLQLTLSRSYVSVAPFRHNRYLDE